MPPQERRRAWEEKRVFFLTPQVLTNDLSRGTCPAQQVKCVVVDEAHKALGNHAYCQVLQQITIKVKYILYSSFSLYYLISVDNSLFLYAQIVTETFHFFQVVRELMNYSNEFRVLALSATPGSDIKVCICTS